MIWAAVASLVALGAVLILTDPATHHDAEDLAAAGWSPAMVTAVSWGCAAIVAIATFTGMTIVTGARAAPALAVALGAWVPLLLLPPSTPEHRPR